jgi:accessory gene regulator protein AgrB
MDTMPLNITIVLIITLIIFFLVLPYFNRFLEVFGIHVQAVKVFTVTFPEMKCYMRDINKEELSCVVWLLVDKPIGARGNWHKRRRRRLYMRTITTRSNGFIKLITSPQTKQLFLIFTFLQSF